MRKGLLATDQVADPTIQRNFARVRAAVEQLTADDDVVASPAQTLITSGAIKPGSMVVVYTGGASQTLTLPPANSQGQGIGFVLVIMNTASVAVTAIPSRGDSINGTTSVAFAPAAMRVLASDGNTKWQST